MRVKPSGPGDFPCGVEDMAANHSSMDMGELSFSIWFAGREGRPEVRRNSLVAVWRLGERLFSKL